MLHVLLAIAVARETCLVRFIRYHYPGSDTFWQGSERGLILGRLLCCYSADEQGTPGDTQHGPELPYCRRSHSFNEGGSKLQNSQRQAGQLQLK